MSNYNLTEKEGITLVKAARDIVTRYCLGSSQNIGEKFQQDFSFYAGVFVILDNELRLRGCIGHPLPDKKLFDAVIAAAIAAATEDPRFPPVKYEELESIRFEVTVLTKPETILASQPDEYLSKIKVGRDGLIVRNKFNAGLLLPQVPVEYGWNEREFLEHTCEKAGMEKDCWMDPDTIIQKFQGIVFKEVCPKGPVIQEKLSE